MTTPIERLRKRHQRWLSAGPPGPLSDRCDVCAVHWPCDVIAALDALEEGLHNLQARLDAATVLIRQAMNEVHLDHYRIDSRGQGFKRIDTCENCRPYREWLGGEGQ